MKLKQNKALNSLSVNLDTKKPLVERLVLKLFDEPGLVKDNYHEIHITTCLAVLLDYYIEGIIIDENERNELISNICNLELTK